MATELGAIPRAVFGVAVEHGEITRREVADELGVSFPSVTTAIAELVTAGLIREVRREQGPRGRASLVYGVAPSAGWALGLDIGSTQVACLAQGLDGTELFRTGVDVPRDIEAAGRAAADLLRRALRTVPGPLRALAIAVNQIVPQSPFAEARATHPRASRIVELALEGIDLGGDVPIAVENNVNCAAVAEHEDGAMRGVANCAYLQVGVGIGLGLFIEGALARGASGASGELAQVPLSWDASIASPRDAIEARYGSSGMVARAAELLGDGAPESAEELFTRAERDDVARAVMTEHAIALARIAVAAATVVDPAVIVVGGGLAKNDRFVTCMREEFLARLPHIELRPSSKGTAATVQGAVLIARDLALANTLGARHRRLVPRPALWSGRKTPRTTAPEPPRTTQWDGVPSARTRARR